MTRYATDRLKIADWALVSSRMIEQTQTLAELPDDVRQFPRLRAADIRELTGCSDWLWREYVSSLPEDERPQTSPGGHYRASLEDVHRFMERRGIRPRRPDHVPRGIRVAVENFKGGVAKSSAALHLGVAWARMGYRVLLIDTDPQATLTQMLGVRPARVPLEDTIAAVLSADQPDSFGPLKPRPTYISGLSLLPSSLHLTRLEIEIMSRLNNGSGGQLEAAFNHALAQIDADYDMVLVDYQPAFSMTQALLLLTMDSLIIPMPTEAADFAGTSDFLYQIAEVLAPLEQLRGAPKRWDPTLVVHTRLRKGTDLVHEIVAHTFGSNRLLEYVDDQPAISAALATMRSVYEVGNEAYDPRALKRARDQYTQLATKIADIIQQRWAEMGGNGYGD